MPLRFFGWDELSWTTVDEHCARCEVHLDNLMCVMFRLRRGCDLPEHSHPHEQIATVIHGRLIASIGGEEREIGPLEGYVVPADIPHKVTVLEDVLVIDCFSPAREDLM